MFHKYLLNAYCVVDTVLGNEYLKKQQIGFHHYGVYILKVGFIALQTVKEKIINNPTYKKKSKQIVKNEMNSQEYMLTLLLIMKQMKFKQQDITFDLPEEQRLTRMITSSLGVGVWKVISYQWEHKQPRN